jgi:putative flippase GtrA
MSENREQKGALQFTKFSMIGIFNGVIDLLALNALIWIWHPQNVIGLTLINSFAYVLAVLNSYYWNSRLTFRRNALFTSKEKIKFAAQATVSLFISNGVFLVSVYGLGLFPIPLWVVHNASKGLSMAISSTCSYFFMKLVVFKT